jgi:hypothetical protein
MNEDSNMEMHDLWSYAERFPSQWAAAATFAEFAAALDGSKPGPGRLLQHIAATYPDSWENGFQTLKNHGFLSKPLLLPHACKAADIFADVSLYPFATGGRYRHENSYVEAGAAFISALRAPGFAYFGRLGANYAPRNGNPAVAGGLQVLTGAKPSPAVVAAYGKAGADDWDLATFEAVQWSDGRILVVARAHNGFGQRWLCLLDAGESALSMLSDHERGEIEAEEARKAEQRRGAA